MSQNMQEAQAVDAAESWTLRSRMSDGTIGEWSALKSEHPTSEDAINAVLAQQDVKSVVCLVKS